MRVLTKIMGKPCCWHLFGMDCMETDGSLTDSCLSLSGASCAANMLCDRLEPGPCVGAALYALGTWIHALPKGLEIFQHCGSFIPPATDGDFGLQLVVLRQP